MNKDLLVHEDLPEDFVMTGGNAQPRYDGYGHVYGIDDDQYFGEYHHCPYCKGWISGRYDEKHENSAGILAGKQGVNYCCQRCGQKIAFVGKVF
jgi:DNA-directed RNA polymerase subunit RPC12/RpoP